MPVIPEKPVLYLPVSPYHVNQPFGYNIPCVQYFNLANESIVDGADSNTCPVGYTKLYAEFNMKGHNGIDLEAGIQNVYAACDGIVIEQQTQANLGLGLGIITNEPVSLPTIADPSNPNPVHYLKLRYWHLQSFKVKVGQSVKAGDLIAVSDNTGYSSGNHLHFEGNPMDKLPNGNYILSFPNNGYAGAIDISPYLSTQFAQDIALAAIKTDVQQLSTVLENHPNPMQLDLVHQAIEAIREFLMSL